MVYFKLIFLDLRTKGNRNEENARTTQPLSGLGRVEAGLPSLLKQNKAQVSQGDDE